MRYLIFWFGLMLLMVGCSEYGPLHSESEQQAAIERNKAAARAFASAQFSVNVRLSDAANRKLTDSKETIRVEGLLSGHQKNPTELRTIFLRSVVAEIHPGETATFNDLGLTPDVLALMDSHGPRILIIVSSGKLGVTENLLSCEVYDDNFELINGRTIYIPCPLIKERLPRQRIEISAVRQSSLRSALRRPLAPNGLAPVRKRLHL